MTRVSALAKLSATVLVAAITGLLLGVGLGKVSVGTRPASPPKPRTATTPTAAGTTTVTGGGASAQPLAGPAAPLDVTIRLRSAVLQPAATAYGRKRRRARLTVAVAVANTGVTVATPGPPALLVGAARVLSDPHDTQLGPIRAGATASLVLHFELVGSITTRLTDQPSATLEIAGHALTIAVTLGTAVAPSNAGP